MTGTRYHHACVHPHYHSYEPVYDVYGQAYGTVDESADLATSLDDDGWPTAGTLPLNREPVPYEHELPPPDWEYEAETNSGHDDELGTRAFACTAYHAVEHRVDDTASFGREHTSLWHELQAADGDWVKAALRGGDGYIRGRGSIGRYVHPNYQPPTFPHPSGTLPPTPQPDFYIHPLTPTSPFPFPTRPSARAAAQVCIPAPIPREGRRFSRQAVPRAQSCLV